jgi:phenylacetate-CoA ligase
VEYLENFFNCRFSSFYGHSERLIFAIAKPGLQEYAPNLDYGYIELIDNEGKVITENNVIGELVGTSYDNKVMPLIRYKTGDYTSYSDYETRTFGPIEGKWGQLTLLGLNGEEITLTALNLHSHELNDVLKVQFVQNSKGSVTIRIMFSGIKTMDELRKLEGILSNRVGKLIEFHIEISDTFLLNSRGKAPLIINSN